MTTEPRNIEINLSMDNVKAALETQLRAFKVIQDHEDVILDFNTQTLKDTQNGSCLPVLMKISPQPRYQPQEVHVNTNNGS